MKIAIIGNGQLGTYVFNNFSKNYKTKMYSLDNGFDFTNQNDIEEIVLHNDIIINCAALTNVDMCEQKPDLSKQINQDAPGNIARLCKEYDKALIHISTDYVYGSNDLIEDLDEVDYFMKHPLESCPINRYGFDKLLADETICSLKLNKFLIIRPSWVFGKTNPQNFIEKIKNVLLSKEEILVVDDQFGVPTSVDLIYNVMQDFILNKIPNGVYNLRNEIEKQIVPSRYEIACYIKELLKCDCKIIRCSTETFILPARRQLNSFLNINKIKNVYNNDLIIKTWKEEISLYFNQC
jgi:dTDP-4-dehydrorhamnose reductase